MTLSASFAKTCPKLISSAFSLHLCSPAITNYAIYKKCLQGHIANITASTLLTRQIIWPKSTSLCPFVMHIGKQLGSGTLQCTSSKSVIKRMGFPSTRTKESNKK